MAGQEADGGKAEVRESQRKTVCKVWRDASISRQFFLFSYTAFCASAMISALLIPSDSFLVTTGDHFTGETVEPGMEPLLCADKMRGMWERTVAVYRKFNIHGRCRSLINLPVGSEHIQSPLLPGKPCKKAVDGKNVREEI